MKFSDFPLNEEIKIKPIDLVFGLLGTMEQKEIKSIVFLGKFQGNYCFDFYYRPGFAKYVRFPSQKQFEYFIEDVVLAENKS